MVKYFDSFEINYGTILKKPKGNLRAVCSKLSTKWDLKKTSGNKRRYRGIDGKRAALTQSANFKNKGFF